MENLKINISPQIYNLRKELSTITLLNIQTERKFIMQEAILTGYLKRKRH